MLKRVFAAALVFLFMSAVGNCEITWTDTSPMTIFLAEHYAVDPIVVISLGQRMSKYDDDASTAIYLAKLANIDPMKMLDPRIEGKSWNQIMKRLEIDPKDLFIKLDSKVIPGKFRYEFRQYEKTLEDPEYQMVLYDDNIRNLVQLRLMKEAFGKNPIEVMNSISQGYAFTELIEEELNKNLDKNLDKNIE